eukprot:scaffold5688_cov104-Cylindrotheca_fusiformis.AAC.8
MESILARTCASRPRHHQRQGKGGGAKAMNTQPSLFESSKLTEPSCYEGSSTPSSPRPGYGASTPEAWWPNLVEVAL